MKSVDLRSHRSPANELKWSSPGYPIECATVNEFTTRYCQDPEHGTITTDSIVTLCSILESMQSPSWISTASISALSGVAVGGGALEAACVGSAPLVERTRSASDSHAVRTMIDAITVTNSSPLLDSRTVCFIGMSGLLRPKPRLANGCALNAEAHLLQKGRGLREPSLERNISVLSPCSVPMVRVWGTGATPQTATERFLQLTIQAAPLRRKPSGAQGGGQKVHHHSYDASSNWVRLCTIGCMIRLASRIGAIHEGDWSDVPQAPTTWIPRRPRSRHQRSAPTGDAC